MKFKGNLIGAGISLAIFLAFAIAGGICFASGLPELASNTEVIGELEGIFEDVVDIVDDFTPVEFGGDSGRETAASYERELRSDVKSIVIEKTGCIIKVRSGSEFSVSYKGKVKSAALDSDSAKVTGTEDSVNYYKQDGALYASFRDGVLTIGVETVSQINIVGFENIAKPGEMIITIPASYNGSFGIESCFGEVAVTALTVESLTLDKCAGEIEVYGCDIGCLVIDDLAGEVDVEDSEVQSVSMNGIAGEVNLSTTAAFTADCSVRNVAGEVNVEIPYGSGLNIVRNNVLGEVRVDKNLAGGAEWPDMEIDSVMGEVSVEYDS